MTQIYTVSTSGTNATVLGAPLTTAQANANLNNLTLGKVPDSAGVNKPNSPPSLNINFTTGTLDPRITFTRAGTATRTNAQGILETVAATVPRFEYDPVTLQCRGLLVEASSTNLLTYSNTFSGWGYGGVSLTTSTLTAPVGSDSVNLLTESTGFSVKSVKNTITGVTSGSFYTFSAYVKPLSLTNRKLTIIFYDASSIYTGMATTFDLASLTSYTTSNTPGFIGGAASTSFINNSATITTASNGWVRVTVTSQIMLTSFIVRLKLRTSNQTFIDEGAGDSEYAGDGVSGVYVWGMQLENRNWATSYIPTNGSQVTRAQDYCSFSGVNFSSWWNPTGGTFFADLASYSGGYGWEFQTGARTPYIELSTWNWGSGRPFSTPGGTLGSPFCSAGKAAVSLTNNEARICKSGTYYGSYTTGLSIYNSPLPYIDKLTMGISSFSTITRSIKYYPQPMSEAQLRGLTS